MSNPSAPSSHDVAAAPGLCAKALTEGDASFPAGATVYVGTEGDVHGVPWGNAAKTTNVVFKGVKGHLAVRFRSVDVGASTAEDMVAIW